MNTFLHISVTYQNITKYMSLKQDLHLKSAKCFSEQLSKLTNVTSDTDKGSQCAELTKRDNEGGADEY